MLITNRSKKPANSKALKTHYSRIAMNALLILVLSICYSNSFATEFVNHDHWQRVLNNHVNENGLVDYTALHQNSTALNEYLQQIKSTSPLNHPDLFNTSNSQLAYYINAYNALVFKGVLERGPEKESVWKGLISGYGFFVKMKFIIGGTKMNLKTLEDDYIRAFNDPRIHAAINCASISCPRLSQDAYQASTLDQQLDQAMIEFVNSPQHVQVNKETSTVYVSKIFDWFSEDFIQKEAVEEPISSVIDYINLYRSAENKIDDQYDISFLEYDKSINQQTNKS